jgi:hypothetical protein
MPGTEFVEIALIGEFVIITVYQRITFPIVRTFNFLRAISKFTSIAILLIMLSLHSYKDKVSMLVS